MSAAIASVVISVGALVASGCADDDPAASVNQAAASPRSADTTTRSERQGSRDVRDEVGHGEEEDEGRTSASNAAPAGGTRLAPQPVGAVAEFGNGLVAKVEEVRLVDVEALGPGETSGPAVVVELELSNRSDEPIDLAFVAVNVTGGGGEVGIPNQGELTQPLQGMLQRGERRAGTYVFRLNGERAGVVIDVYHAASENVVVIES